MGLFSSTVRLFVNDVLLKLLSLDELTWCSGENSVTLLLWVRGVLKATLVVKAKVSPEWYSGTTSDDAQQIEPSSDS